MPASEAGSRIAELEGKRKQLTSGGNLKEKHNNWGSVLLGLGVTFSVLGPVNTYLRTGEWSHADESCLQSNLQRQWLRSTCLDILLLSTTAMHEACACRASGTGRRTAREALCNVS